jgi:GNAT superfamily N-acetyltransferase
MKIRPILVEDLPALSRVYVESFKQVDPSELWTEEKAGNFLNFIYRAQPDLAYLVEAENKIIGGILGMIKPWWDSNHLAETEIFFDPNFQNKGYGTKLFLHFLEQAKSKYQVTIMESLTFKDIEFPLSWYIKLGFEAKKDWQVIFGDITTVIDNLKKSSIK